MLPVMVQMLGVVLMKVTGCPALDGFAELVIVIVLPDAPIAIVCVTGGAGL